MPCLPAELMRAALEQRLRSAQTCASSSAMPWPPCACRTAKLSRSACCSKATPRFLSAAACAVSFMILKHLVRLSSSTVVSASVPCCALAELPGSQGEPAAACLLFLTFIWTGAHAAAQHSSLSPFHLVFSVSSCPAQAQSKGLLSCGQHETLLPRRTC